MLTLIRNKAFLTLWFGLFFGIAGQEVYNLLPKHFELQNFAPETVGFIMGFTGFGGLFILPLLLLVIDRYSKRRILLFLLTLHAFIPLLYFLPLSPHYLYFFPRFLQGILISGLMISFTSLQSYVIEPERRGHGYAVFGIMGQLGLLTGVNLSELLYDRWGLTAAYLLSLALFGLAFLVVRSLQDPAGSEGSVRLRGKASFGGIKGDTGVSVLAGFWKIMKKKGVYPILLRVVLLGFGFGFLLAFIPKIAFSGGLTKVRPFYTAYPITVLLVRIFASPYFDRLPRNLVQLPGLLALPASFILAVGADTGWKLALVGILYGVAHGILFPVLISILMNYADEDFRGRMSVFFHFFFNGGMFVAANAGGLLIAVSLPFALVLSALFSFTGLLPYLSGPLRRLRRSG